MAKSVSLSRYLAGNLAIAVVPLIAACVLGLTFLTSVMRKSLADANAMSATLASSRFEEFFLRPKEALSIVAGMLRRPDRYPADRLESYIEDARSEYPFLRRVQIIGPDGRVAAVAPSEPGLIGISRVGEALYESIRSTSLPFWSDSYITTAGNQPGISFGQAVEGKVVLCDLSLDWLSGFAATTQMSSTPGIKIHITDRHGIFLSAPDQGSVARREKQAGFERLRQAAGLGSLVWLEEGGEDWLASSAAIKGSGWYVIVMFPASVLSGSLLAVSLGVAALALLGSGASSLFWRRRFRRIQGVLDAISRQAERISAGEYEVLGAFGGGFLELERVGGSMDSMVAAIGERESTLKARERGFREILERIDLPAIGLNRDRRIVFANTCFLALAGRSEADALRMRIGDFCAERGHPCSFELALQGRPPSSAVVCILSAADGGTREVHWSIVTDRDEAGAFTGLIAVGHDMTEIIEHRIGLERSLREKEILLREVHHRVKNNLQVITSLLYIQGSESDDGTVREALEEARGRIQTIALVHETLYGSTDLEDLDFGPYAEGLARLLLSESAASDIRLECRCAALRLDLEESIPCGLILTEAIVNVQKHAFPRGWTGERRVLVEVETMADGTARLAVRDSGAGIESRDESPGRRGMGRQIIRALADQLRGSLAASEGEGGTSVELTFRPKSAGKRGPGAAAPGAPSA